MNCRPCYKNGRKVDGGELGVCKSHRKRKCSTCPALSLGEEFCASCAGRIELMRWQAKAEFRVVNPTDELDDLEIRREKLQQAKFMAHQAIEIMFHSMLSAIKAIWGKDLPQSDDKDEDAA